MTKKLKVYIEDNDAVYAQMFIQYGWDVVDSVEEADLVQFVGGADINPALYKNFPHETTWYSNNTDLGSLGLFELAFGLNKPMAGICRGSQFLHVMADGKLVQDCDNHAVPDGHMAKLGWMPNTEILVSSTHHQMMYSEDVGEVLMYSEGIATKKETMDADGAIVRLRTGIDIEAMYYEHINAISFQPHPEFVVHNDKYKDCADAYFFIIRNYLNLGV